MEELNIRLGMSITDFIFDNGSIGYIVITYIFDTYRVLIPRDQSIFKFKNEDLDIDTKNFFIITFDGTILTSIEEDEYDRPMRFYVEGTIEDIKAKPKNSDRKSISVHWPNEPETNEENNTAAEEEK